MVVDQLVDKLNRGYRALGFQTGVCCSFADRFSDQSIQNKRIKLGHTSLLGLFLMLLTSTSVLFGQPPDSISRNRARLFSESQNRLDTLPPGDSIPTSNPYTLSNDAIDDKVERQAADSTLALLKDGKRRYYLFGNAKVNYQDINLEAGIIELDFENDVIIARPIPDSIGRLVNYPRFNDGTQEFTADSIKYNYKTGKGKVYNMRTQQDDIQIIGRETKFIRNMTQDTTVGDIVNTSKAIFTTCTHPEPHFGIKSNKVKIIPNKLAVVGPSNLEIMGIPTPIAFPFGFIPLKTGRKTGLIFPNDYEYSPQLGFGLRNVGWFFPLGEHVNLSVTGNIYLKGSYGLNVASSYNQRYKYSGNLNLGFDSRKIENTSDGSFSRSNAYSIRFSHRQDSRAHPTNTFGGSVNIQTNNFQGRVFNDAQNVLQSQLSSNLNFSKKWNDKPISLSVGLSHTQNTQTQEMTINFPNAKFLTQSIYPFRKPGGRQTWYENTVIRYDAELKNRIKTPDSLLFTQQTLEDAQLGMRQRVNLSNSFKVLRNFNFNPTANYEEVWYMKSIDRTFDDANSIRVDTIYNADSTAFNLDTTFLDFGTVVTDTLNGFSSYRTYSVGASVNTRIFFTYENAKGFLRGLRWEMRPSISFNYSPNYLATDYFREVQTDTRFPDETDTYSIFEGNIFGAPPQQEEQMAIGYNLNNIFQAKTWSRQDSTVKLTKLIDNIVINGRYNFAADSLRWSPVNLRTTTRLFKGVTTVGFSATFDPYKRNEEGRRINEWTGFRGILPFRFDNANLRFNSRLTVSKIRALFQGQEEQVVTDTRNRNTRNLNQSLADGGDFLSLFENFNISHNLIFRWTTRGAGNPEMEVATNSINCQGNIQLTQNWSVNVGNFGYDFVRKGLSYPSLGLSRDLHCWQMRFDWAPTRGTYNFTIQVKPGTLDFIKIPYQRNNYDTFNRF